MTEIIKNIDMDVIWKSLPIHLVDKICNMLTKVRNVSLQLKAEIEGREWVVRQFANRFKIYQHAYMWNIVENFFATLSIALISENDNYQMLIRMYEDRSEDYCIKLWNSFSERCKDNVIVYMKSQTFTNGWLGWIEDLELREAHWEEVNEEILARDDDERDYEVDENIEELIEYDADDQLENELDYYE